MSGQWRRAARIALDVAPNGVRRRVNRMRHPSHARAADRLWHVVVDQADEFSRSLDGHSEVFRSAVVPFLRRDAASPGRLALGNEAHQSMLEAFTPSFERHLYDYYGAQQYYMFARFLQYPLFGLGSVLDAWDCAASLLPQVRVLDYGAGIPYGLLHLLLTAPTRVSSATLVDLDLVHNRFAEFAVRNLAPELHLTVHRMRDAEQLPDLDQPYTFVFGKDVFEHLLRPADTLAHILAATDEDCFCVLDFQDHGQRVHQHVTPDVRPLGRILAESGFERGLSLGGLSGFLRGAPLRRWKGLVEGVEGPLS
jgi:hypothetical protein